MFPLSLFGYSISAGVAKLMGIAFLAIFFLFIYPNIDSIKGFFGMDTITSLREKNKQQSNELTQLKQTNKDTLDSLQKLNENYQLALSALKDISNAKIAITESNKDIEKRAKEAIDAINRVTLSQSTIKLDKPFVEPFSKQEIDFSKTSKETAVSMVQIGSVWSTYCRSVFYQTKECKAYEAANVVKE